MNNSAAAIGTYSSIDRIVFSAIVVSVVTKQALALPGILGFDTNKGENGDAGSWSMTLPMAQTFEGAPNPAPQYAKIANPMDVIAIYALRLVSTDASSNGVTSVPQMPPGGITWGAPNFVKQLTSIPSCIFVGMLDEARVRVTADPPAAHLILTGHDLTKIFLTNDTSLPVVLAALQVYDAVMTQAGSIIAAGEKSATELAEVALDYMVSRKSLPGQPPFPAGLEPFAFPWRNFISLDKTDDNFVPLNPTGKAPNIPDYQIQDGTAWSNMTDLRNAPIARLFIDEFGSMIFDDAVAAWTGQYYSNGVLQAGPPPGPLTYGSVYTITEPEVLSYDFFINDNDLMTVITVAPAPTQVSSGTAASLQLLKGTQLDDMLPGQGSSATVQAAPVNMDPGNVQMYGMRYGAYTSMWDVTVAAAQNRWRPLAINHNSICFAEVVVRGRPIYSVGKRVTLGVPAHRPEFQNAIWYIQNCAHSATFGSTWTTRLTLRYPFTDKVH